MLAIVYDNPGPTSVLHPKNRPVPAVGENDVLIRTVAAGVNRPDIIQRLGKYPAPAGAVQDVLGLEVSGFIERIGRNVTRWRRGDEVCALIPGGGYAEYVSAHEGSCLPIPAHISLEDAAALPETLFTVWHNVFQRGGLKKGETALIYGASGGIGSMAVQLISIYGAHAFALAGSPEKAAFCTSLGAEKVIDYTQNNLLDTLLSESIDLILDSLGGKFLDIGLTLLKPEGRLVYINAMEGNQPGLDIMKVMKKRLFITGSTLRPRDLDFKASLANDIKQYAFPLLEDQRFKSVVNYRFPAKNASDAHELMESRDFTGKIILQF